MPYHHLLLVVRGTRAVRLNEDIHRMSICEWIGELEVLLGANERILVHKLECCRGRVTTCGGFEFEFESESV
jgi:hypothetical protein